MIQFALIGCGRIAWRHAEQMARVGKLAAVFDVDEEKAATLAARYGARVYTASEDLLQHENEVQLVAVCSPNGLHAGHAIKSLHAAKHVLCEKPMCLTTADAAQIIEAEKISGKKVFVVKSARFNPLLQQLKAALSNNTLGSLYSFQLSCFWNRPKEYYQTWHGKKSLDGGTLFTQFSHYIDVLVWLFGMPEAACGFSANAAHGNAIEFEDTGAASLQMKNGMLGTLNWSVNAYQKNCTISLTLLAEKGTIILGGEYLNEVWYQVPEFISGERGSTSQPREAARSSSFHKDVYDSLLHALQEDENSITNAFDGLQTVAFIEQVYKAVRPHEN